eukprot:jgi/Ulvmu1/6162/UM028_0018.1
MAKNVMPSDRLKDFTIQERKIGRGSFGEVFLMAHKQTGKQYVLKKVRLSRLNDWQRNASHMEMRLGQQLQHPFVVPHHSSWVDRGHTVHMVHEYCANGDLNSLLQQQKGKGFHEEELRLWLAECLLALAYIHSQGVIHRDLKPSNLFLNDSRDILIGDFGLATYRKGDPEEDHSFVGTPPYMSPEIINNEDHSFETDIWSLACCMWELSSGKPAFQAFNLEGLEAKIVRGQVTMLPKRYSSEWALLLRSMLVADPAKRATIAALLETPCMQAATTKAHARRRQLEAAAGMPVSPRDGALGSGDHALADSASMSHPSEAATEITRSTSINSDLDSAMTPAQPGQGTAVAGPAAAAGQGDRRRPVVPPLRLESRFSATDDSPPPSNRSVTVDSLRSSETAALHGAHRLSLGSMYSTEGPECVFYDSGVPVLRSPRRRSAVTDPGTRTTRDPWPKAPATGGYARPAVTPRTYTPRGTNARQPTARRNGNGAITPRDTSPRKPVTARGTGAAPASSRKAVVPRPGMSPRVGSPQKATTPRGMPPWGVGNPRGTATPRDRNTPRGGRSPTKRTVTAAATPRTKPGGLETPRNRPTPRGNVSPRERPTTQARTTPRPGTSPKDELPAWNRQTPRSGPSTQTRSAFAHNDRLTPRAQQPVTEARSAAPRSTTPPHSRLTPRSNTPPHVRLTPRQAAVRHGVNMPRSATPPRGLRTAVSHDADDKRPRSASQLTLTPYERASSDYARSPLMPGMQGHTTPRSFQETGGEVHKRATEDAGVPQRASIDSITRSLSAVSEPLPSSMVRETAQAAARVRASASAALSATASTDDDAASDHLTRASSQDMLRVSRSFGSSGLPRAPRPGSASPVLSTPSEAPTPFGRPLQQVPEEEEDARDGDSAPGSMQRLRSQPSSSKVPVPNLSVPRPIPMPRPESAKATAAHPSSSSAPSDPVFAWGSAVKEAVPSSPAQGVSSGSPARPNVARRALKTFQRLAEAATVSSSRRSRSRNAEGHEPADAVLTGRSPPLSSFAAASVASGGSRLRSPSPTTSHGSGMTYRTEPGRKPSPFVAGSTGKSHRAATVRSTSPRRARSRGPPPRSGSQDAGRLRSPLRRTQSGAAGDAAAATLEERLQQRGIASPWTLRDPRHARMSPGGYGRADRPKSTPSVLGLLPPRSGGSGGPSRTSRPHPPPRQPSGLGRKSVDANRSRQLQLPRPTTAPASAGAAVPLPRSPSLMRRSPQPQSQASRDHACPAARPAVLLPGSPDQPAGSSYTTDSPRSVHSPSLAGEASLTVTTPPRPLKPSASSSSTFSPTLPFTSPSHIYGSGADGAARSPDKPFGCAEAYSPGCDVASGLQDTVAAMEFAGLDDQGPTSADLAATRETPGAAGSGLGASSSFASTPQTARAFLQAPHHAGAASGTGGEPSSRAGLDAAHGSAAGPMAGAEGDEAWHVYQPWLSSSMSWPQSGEVDAETPVRSPPVPGHARTAAQAPAAQRSTQQADTPPRRSPPPQPLMPIPHSGGDGSAHPHTAAAVPWRGGSRAPLDSDEHMKLHSAGERQRAGGDGAKRRSHGDSVLPSSPYGLRAHEGQHGEGFDAFDPAALRRTDVMKEREAAWGRSPASSRTASRSPDKRDADGKGQAMADMLALAVMESLEHIRSHEYLLAEATLENVYHRYMRRLSVRKRLVEEASSGIGSSGAAGHGTGIKAQTGKKKGVARCSSARAPRRRSTFLEDVTQERPHRSSSASRLPQYASMSPRPQPASATRRRAEERAEDQRVAKKGRPPKAPDGQRRTWAGPDREASGKVQPLPIRQGTVDELEAHRKGGQALVAAGRRVGEAADMESAAARNAVAVSAIEAVSHAEGPVTQLSMTDDRSTLPDATFFSVADSQLLDEVMNSGFDADTMQAMLSRIDAEVAAMPQDDTADLAARQGPHSAGPSSYGQRLEARVGDMVRVGAVPAVVRYVGPVDTLGPGTWVGLELSMACGTCDGGLNGVEYFKCGQRCGAFIAATALTPDNDDSFAMDL